MYKEGDILIILHSKDLSISELHEHTVIWRPNRKPVETAIIDSENKLIYVYFNGMYYKSLGRPENKSIAVVTSRDCTAIEVFNHDLLFQNGKIG
jgi:hypothetical protein